MLPDAINEVFIRLCRAASKIEDNCKFAHNDNHLRYILSSPTNFGTFMSGSVHMKLPKLKMQKEKFQAIEINTK